MDIIPDTKNITFFSLYNDLIIVYNYLSKMENFILLSGSQALDFSFIIETTPPNPSDFRFIMK